MEPDTTYLRAVVERPQATFWQALGRGLVQLPRLALFLGLGAVTVTFIGALALTMRETLRGAAFDRMSIGVLLWTWGAIVLLAELCVLAVRDAAGLAWPGAAPSAVSLLLRALLGLAMIGILSAASIDRVTLFSLELSFGAVLFAWWLPSALRGIHTCRWGLRSLAAGGAPSSPGRLATLRGRLGRRLVVGRLERDAAAVTLRGDGELARLERRPDDVLVQLDGPEQALCVIAEAHVDDGGYRSAGVRLDAGGLPLWILAADGVEARLAGFRARLRLAARLDAFHVGAAVLGGVLVALYLLAVLLAAL